MSWSKGWIKEVVFGGEKNTFTLGCSKLDGWHSALSNIKSILKGRPFFFK